MHMHKHTWDKVLQFIFHSIAVNKERLPPWMHFALQTFPQDKNWFMDQQLQESGNVVFCGISAWKDIIFLEREAWNHMIITLLWGAERSTSLILLDVQEWHLLACSVTHTRVTVFSSTSGSVRSIIWWWDKAQFRLFWQPWSVLGLNNTVKTFKVSLAIIAYHRGPCRFGQAVDNWSFGLNGAERCHQGLWWKRSSNKHQTY